MQRLEITGYRPQAAQSNVEGRAAVEERCRGNKHRVMGRMRINGSSLMRAGGQ
jgi:hypothetical protein